MNNKALVRDANGAYRVRKERVSETEILEAVEEIVSRRFARGQSLSTPQASKELFKQKLGTSEQEIFAALFLDNRHRVLGYKNMFFGTIDGATVHPREVVKAVLRLNAAAVIFGHCHPSGVAEPSLADQSITRRLKDALSLIDVRVLDHIIVGGADATSLAERGLL
ncbi:MAG: RadC family protein [Gammaproteobacteria bacterium]